MCLNTMFVVTDRSPGVRSLGQGAYLLERITSIASTSCPPGRAPLHLELRSFLLPLQDIVNKLAGIPVTIPFTKRASGGDRAKHILKESALKRMENVDVLANPLAYYSLFRVTLKEELAKAKASLESSEQDTTAMEKASADLEKAINAVFSQHNLTFFAQKKHQIQGCSP